MRRKESINRNRCRNGTYFNRIDKDIKTAIIQGHKSMNTMRKDIEDIKTKLI
jgi:hypothetical protein